MSLYERIEAVAKSVNADVSLFPGASAQRIVVTMQDGSVVPTSFDEAAKEAGIKVSYASGDAVCTLIEA